MARRGACDSLAPHLHRVFLDQETPSKHVQMLDPQPDCFAPPKPAVGQCKDQCRVFAGVRQRMHLLMGQVDMSLLDLPRQRHPLAGLLRALRSATASSSIAAKTPYARMTRVAPLPAPLKSETHCCTAVRLTSAMGT